MRYYDPVLGLFLTQDPVSGELTNPLSLHRYLYAYQNPTVYIDPDGRQSLSKFIDQAAEECGVVTCASLALAKGVYHIATAGFATLHDPIADARDAGQVTDSAYYAYGIGGGLAIAGLNAATGHVGSALIGGAKTIASQSLKAAVVGATSGALDDAANQSINIAAGLQEGFSVAQNLQVASVGAFVGAGAVGVGQAVSRQTGLLAASDTSRRSSRHLTQGKKGNSGNTAVLESNTTPGVRELEEDSGVTLPKRIVTEIVTRSVDAVNTPFIQKSWNPPYSGKFAREFTLGQNAVFVRVHGSGNKARSWMMRPDEVKGLLPTQIKDKFALPELPTHISEVHVPAGTRIRVGKVAPQAGWGQGGAWQYELLERLPEDLFRNTRDLQ